MREAHATQGRSEVDLFMGRVFDNRDAASWRRLGDFILRETSTFEPGNYYFVGRETMAGREVVRIEFYPIGPFWEEVGERINRGVNKTSVVTLWVNPEVHEIVKYTFDNPGLDFLRFRWLLRADGLEALMEMGPIGDVWMPVRMTLSGRARRRSASSR